MDAIFGYFSSLCSLNVLLIIAEVHTSTYNCNVKN